VGPVIVMGVSGCGKSTVAEALAHALGGSWLDADDFHPPENKAKMAAGVPLNDGDRAGWLMTLAGVLKAGTGQADRPLVLACSALKISYRNRLRVAPWVRFLYLKVGFEVAKERMEARSGHFMKSGMVASQFQTLEEPDPTTEPDVVVLDASLGVDRLVGLGLQALGSEDLRAKGP